MASFSSRDLASASERLRALAACARDAGADSLANEVVARADRTSEGRLFVACLGQFKRGKSTLLNALIGEPILPTGVVPVTSAVTILRHGTVRRATIQFANQPPRDVPVEHIAAYVTESGNPANAKAVIAVEVFLSSPILAGGLCFVDTPGIGSSSPLATDVTRAFVPHVDTALVVLGADPPISGEELRLLEELSGEAREFVFAINKADKLSDADLVDVVVFTQRLLMDRTGIVPDALFVVSAAERLTRGEPTRDWSRLEQTLTELAGAARADLLERRVDAAIERISRQTLQSIDALTDAITQSAAENERRLSVLRAWLSEARHAVAEVGLLMAAEQDRIARGLREELSTHTTTLIAATMRELGAAIDVLTGTRAGMRRAAFDQAQTIAKRAIHGELAALEAQAADAYERATSRFVRLANEFLDRLAQAEPRLGSLPSIEPPTDLGGRRRFYFTELMTLTATSPVEWLRDVFSLRAARRKRLTVRAQAYLHRLIETNTSRVVHDLDDRLTESRKDLEADIRARLTELGSAAERAVLRARELQASGEAAMARERMRLEELRGRLGSISTAGSAEPLSNRTRA